MDAPNDVPFLELPPPPPLSLVKPGELQISAPSAGILTDFQRELIRQELAGERGGAPSEKWGVGRMTALDLLSESLPSRLPRPELIYPALAFMLFAPVEGAFIAASPVVGTLSLGLSKAAAYGTRKGLVAAGVSEQTAGWAAVGAEVLTGVGVHAGATAFARLMQTEVYVYQIVRAADGKAVVIKYGVSNNPAVRIEGYARRLGVGFEGMQIISKPVSRAQGLALETWLVSEGRAQGLKLLNRRLMTLAEMKGGALFYGVTETPYSALEPARMTLLNPRLYAH